MAAPSFASAASTRSTKVLYGAHGVSTPVKAAFAPVYAVGLIAEA